VATESALGHSFFCLPRCGLWGCRKNPGNLTSSSSSTTAPDRPKPRRRLRHRKGRNTQSSTLRISAGRSCCQTHPYRRVKSDNSRRLTRVPELVGVAAESALSHSFFCLPRRRLWGCRKNPGNLTSNSSSTTPPDRPKPRRRLRYRKGCNTKSSTLRISAGRSCCQTHPYRRASQQSDNSRSASVAQRQ